MFTQDLFWGNMPCKIKPKSSNMFKDLFKQWKPTNPYMIYTGTNKIDFSKFPITHKLTKKLKTLDIYLYEPLTLYEDGKPHNRDFFSEFKGGEFLRAEELDSIAKFAQNLNCNITVYTCDYNVKTYLEYPFELKCFDIFLRNQFNGGARMINNNISKYFICPNWRYSLHRESLINYIKDIPGYYSWAFSDPPLTIDLDLEATNSTYKKWPDAKLKGPSSLSKFYQDSFCVIANETRFYQPTGNFSEKTVNAMIHKRPFICVAPPSTLEYIRKLGFKTFEKWFDESYDIEIDHNNRLQKIYNLLDDIKSNSIEELKIILNDMNDVLLHNQKLALKIYNNEQVL